jgi:hypothetical protein
VGESETKEPLFQVQKLNDGSARVQAGEVQGIPEGARFAIYGSEDINASPLGYMIAAKPTASTTKLRHQGQTASFQLPSSAWALLVGSPKMKQVSILISPEDTSLCSRVVDNMKKDYGDLYHVEPATDAQTYHDLALIRGHDGYHFFEITDKASRDAGLKRVNCKYSLDKTEPFLDCAFTGAADFYHHLRRTNTQMPYTSSCVSIKAHLLKDITPHFFALDVIMIPKNENEDLNIDGVMHPEVSLNAENDPDSCSYYGFSIVNNTEYPLYIWIFAFEMNDFSISEYISLSDLRGSDDVRPLTGTIFTPTYAKQDNKHVADPSIQPKGSLTIGYGAGGVPPQRFQLGEDQDVGVTYLKVFFSSRFVDLAWMKQKSPFDGSGREITSHTPFRRSFWGTQQLAIVQKRRTAHGA